MDARRVSPVTAQRTLMLLRHAKAEQGQGKLDHARELAPRGRRDARAVGLWLADPSQGMVLDLVLCSTSERTRQTLDGLRAGGASVTETLFDDRIYNGGASSLLDVLREVSPSFNALLIWGGAPKSQCWQRRSRRRVSGRPKAWGVCRAAFQPPAWRSWRSRVAGRRWHPRRRTCAISSCREADPKVLCPRAEIGVPACGRSHRIPP